MAANIVDAVTAILICDGEVYLTRRQIHLTAFPGFSAFPGGKVDQGESEAALNHPLLIGQNPRLVNALARELKEELDFDLSAALAAGELFSFAEVGHALMPPFSPVRFNTFFYRIDLKRRPSFTLENKELSEGEWLRPEQWLAAYLHGELLVAPPTRVALEALAADPDSRKMPAFERGRGDIPMVEALYGVRHFFVRSNTLPPADRTNCFLLGDEDAHRILVDPSPNSREELETLCVQAGAIGFHEVFVTHHHPDHREYANEIARRFGVPIGMSADTQARIRAKQPKWLDGLSVKIWADGDVVTRWLNQPLRVVAVPGHDEGQLALMPDNRAFCIVGDLIQGVGTVVISAPEGDMRKYFATLERVIALAPQVIYPSHGPALGGVYYLQQTLKHRRAREAQIKSLSEAGRSVEEMLAEMYVGTDPRLMPLARMNIDSHLTKLRAEGLEAAAVQALLAAASNDRPGMVRPGVIQKG